MFWERRDPRFTMLNFCLKHPCELDPAVDKGGQKRHRPTLGEQDRVAVEHCVPILVRSHLLLDNQYWDAVIVLCRGQPPSRKTCLTPSLVKLGFLECRSRELHATCFRPEFCALHSGVIIPESNSFLGWRIAACQRPLARGTHDKRGSTALKLNMRPSGTSAASPERVPMIAWRFSSDSDGLKGSDRRMAFPANGPISSKDSSSARRSFI